MKPDDWDDEEDGEWEPPQIGKLAQIYDLKLIIFCKRFRCTLNVGRPLAILQVYMHQGVYDNLCE